MTNAIEASDPTDAQAGEACPECGAQARLMDERRGETVCASCGLVLDEGAIDPGPEWRAFDASQREKRARTGPARTTMRHDRGLGSQIGFDSHGLSSDLRSRLNRLRRHHQRATYRPGADRGLVRALSEIERIGGALDLPDRVAETAARIYRQAREEGFPHGRSLEATAAASVLAAARIHNVPRQIDDLAAVAQVEDRQAIRTFRKLVRELSLPVPANTPLDLLPSIASKLGASPAAEQEAREHLEALDPTTASGKNPASLVAAAIYLASLGTDHRFTQEEVAEAAGVTAVTLRARVKDLQG